MPKPLIIGFDPGLTGAIAMLDLEGNLAAVSSRKNWPLAEIIGEIGKTGRPLLVSTDKANTPVAVKKLASAFSAKLWAPDCDLGVEEKKKLVDGMEGTERCSQHERDAMAAALAAYKSMASGFSKVEDTLRLLGLEEKGEDIKQLLLTKRAKNLTEAVDMISEKKPEEPERVEIRTTPSGQLRTDDLIRKIRSLQNTVEVQKAYIDRLEQKFKEMEKSRQQMIDERVRQTTEAKKAALRDKELGLREQMISGLRQQLAASEKEKERAQQAIERKAELEQLVAEGRVPMVPVKGWSKEALAEADRFYGLKDRLIWIADFKESNAAPKYCVALGIKGVIGELDEKTAERLRQTGIMAVTGLKPEGAEWWVWAEKKDFEGALRSTERKGFVNWLSGYRQRAESE